MAPADLPNELRAHSSADSALNTVDHSSASPQDHEQTVNNESTDVSRQIIVREDHRSDAAKSEKLVHTNNSLPNNGYGDFCFGRRIDGYYLESSRPYYYPEWNSDNAVPILGPNTLPCLKPFEFFQLPLEIRRQIYRLLLGPFYSLPPSHGPKLQDHTTLYIQHNEPGYSYLPDADLEGWLTYTFDDVNARDLQRAFIQQQRVYSLRKSAQHSGRSSNYLLRAYCYFGKTADGQRSTYAFLNWVRQASNVSKSFRRELGDVFWAKTYISVGTLDHSDLTHLKHFLNDRPTTHSGIKKLRLTLIFDFDAHEKAATEFFPELCALLVKTVKLEELEIIIVMNAEGLKDMVEGRGQFACLAACKDCIVTKNFGVDLCPLIQLDSGEDYYEDYPGQQKFLGSLQWPLERKYYMPDIVQEERDLSSSLSDEYGPLVREFMMPDMLRKAQGLSVEQDYLKALDPAVEKEEDDLLHDSSD